MKRLRRFVKRLTSWAKTGRDEERLRAEIESHIALQTQDNLRAGMAPNEARRQAVLKFGAVESIKEEYRDQRRLPFIEDLLRDVQYALRQLRRNPGFTIVAVLTLALGIGANTAIFSVVSGVLLSPLPFQNPERLMMLDEKWLPRFPHFEAPPQDFEVWREQCHAFDQLAAFARMAFNLTGGGPPERISGARVSANLPSLLGVGPIMGRSFSPTEDVAGNDRVVLLGYQLWHRRFMGDPRVIGRVVKLNGINFTVIGVMPSGFDFPKDAGIWKPMAFTQEDLQKGHFIEAIGRLRPGATRARAQAEMDLIMPRPGHVWSANVFPLQEYYVGGAQTALCVLLGAAGFVLLIACVNLANLLLARGAARQKEISVRSSLGAVPRRLAQQLVTESVLLSLIGGAFGLLLGYWGIRALKLLALASIPRLNQVTVDYSVLMFTLSLSVLTGLFFGMVPALRLSRGTYHDALHSGDRSTLARVGTRMRSALAASEVALAFVLVAGAGLLLQTFWRLVTSRPGFSPESVLTMSINLPKTNYTKPYQQRGFVDQLLQGIQAVPGVRQAAVSTSLPLSGIIDVGIMFDPNDPASKGGTTANYYAVTPFYFQSMGIPLIRGRLFLESDSTTGLPVVIINQTMAKRFFADGNPIGKRLTISGPSYMSTIIGVVGDVKQASLNAPVPPQVYEPFFQKPADSFRIVVRGHGDPDNLVEVVRRQVRAIDHDLPISDVRTMKEIVTSSVRQDLFSACVLGIFAFLALALSAVGIYGVMSYSVSQRTHEIGIRMALGAEKNDVLRMVVGQGIKLALIGVVIGVAGALALTRFLASLLYGVKPTDPLTFIAVSLILIAVAVAACYVPARRAAKVDPMVALRYE